MRRFAPVLKRINDRLVLPQPLKYRIMKEIAADLEDTYAMYIRQGLREDEAERRSVNRIAADDTVIDQLIEIHEAPVRAMLRKLSDRMQHRIELGLWLALLFVVGVLMARMLIGSPAFAGSGFNWLTAVLITGMFGISARKYYELYIKRDHSPDTLHRGLPLLIYSSVCAAVAGTLGCFVELQQFALRVAESGDIPAAIPDVFRSLTAVSFGYAAAITGGVAWLLLTMRTLTIEDMERAVSRTLIED